MASNLKQQLFSGVFYTALAKYSGIVISLVVAGVLARLLTPDDFAIVAIATVIIAFFSTFTDMGISPAIVQNKALTEKDLSDIFSFTLWMGAGLSVLFFAASWPIAAYYESPILRTLCQLLCVNLFFASATIVPNALFFKNKEFKFIALRSFAVQVASGTAAVIAAYQFLFNVINYFSRNLDKLLIGKYMGMSELGYYEKSYRLMMLPLQNITQVVTPVMHPIFSDYQNDLNRLASAYERILRLLAFIGIPLSVLLFFTAEEVTLIIFGQQWLPSVPVFRILTLSVGVQIILSSSGSIFQAAGDTRSLFVCGVFSSVLNVTGMLLGIFWFGTLEAVAWCIVTTFCINFIQCYWQMYRVTLRRSMWTLLRQFTSPIIAGMLIAAALIPLHYLTNNGNIFLTFILKSIVSFTIFGIYIQITREYDLMGKIQKIAHKRKK